MRWRRVAGRLLPPIVADALRRVRDLTRGPPAVPEVGLHGDFGSWAEAARASTGYDADVILERTRSSVLRVKQGEAAYERDSVLFEEVRYAWPLLAGLMWAAARAGGRLNVVDFGGALGTSYFQNRLFLAGLRDVRWNVVEQPRHVQAGKDLLEDEHLRFYSSASECFTESSPTVLVLSGVLQYLEEPMGTLDELLEFPVGTLIIDRTPFWNGPDHRLCVQSNPAEIYPASYPSWILSHARLRSRLESDWRVLAEFDSLDFMPAPVPATWKGMIAARRPEAGA